MKEYDEALPLARNKICFLIATVSTRVIAHKTFEHIFLPSVQHQMIHCISIPFDWLQVINTNNVRLLASQVMASYNGRAKPGLFISQLCRRRNSPPLVRSIAIENVVSMRDLACILVFIATGNGQSANNVNLRQAF